MDEKQVDLCTNWKHLYEDQAIELQCEVWCAETKSCNLDIIGLSFEARPGNKS